MPELRIDRRFAGPPHAANGGYVSGQVAGVLAGTAEVTLRAPTPLDTPLVLTKQADRATLHSAQGDLLVEAISIDTLDVALPSSVSFDEATRASLNYVGFTDHPYPGCYVCGPARPPGLGAGLGIFPGAVKGTERLVAAPFQPVHELCDEQGLLRPELIWAALDCTSWFGHAAFVGNPAKVLLGRLAAAIQRRPRAGERCVVHGFAIGQEGRKIQCGSALAGEDGAWIARARATWIELKP